MPVNKSLPDEPTFYFLPRRYTNLSASQLDLWDAFYFLAARNQWQLQRARQQAQTSVEIEAAEARLAAYPPGSFETSTGELEKLTGVNREAIKNFREDALHKQLIKEDVSLQTGKGFFVQINGYAQEKKSIIKPAGYLTNGWLLAIRGKNNQALPKRLLNYYLSLPENVASRHTFDSEELRQELRRRDINPLYQKAGELLAEKSILKQDIIEAHFLLQDLGLIMSRATPPVYYQVDKYRLQQAPPASDKLDRLQKFRESEQYSRYQKLDTVRLAWLEEILQIGRYPLETTVIEAIWQDLAFLYNEVERFKILRRKVVGQRAVVGEKVDRWKETWRLYGQALVNRATYYDSAERWLLPLTKEPADCVISWNDKLAEFSRSVTDHQLRGRLQIGQRGLSSRQFGQFQLDLASRSNPQLLHTLVEYREKEKTLAQLPQLFFNPRTAFPLEIKVQDWDGADKSSLELWFQGLQLTVGRKKAAK